MSDKKEKEQTLQTYASSASKLRDYYLKSGVRKADIKRAFDLLGSSADPKVVEIGCGGGRDATEILKHTPNYVGFDITPEFIEAARKLNPKGEFVVADLSTYDFPGAIDIVMAFASLLHSGRTELTKVFQKVHAALNPGGIFYISTKKGDEYHKFEKKDKFGTRYFYAYTKTDIEKMSKGKFSVGYYDEQCVNGSDWFTIALRKT